MYTWGYLKEAILSKLDLDSDEASVMAYIGRFHIFANECMTMICSTVKPCRKFYEFTIGPESDKIVTMPSDFISFGDDVSTIDEDVGYGTRILREIHDDDLRYVGYNQLLCKSLGDYSVSYNSRWHEFGGDDDNDELNIPPDILDCIPSYVASQCIKVDDDYKASVLRNEFEVLFSRIDDTNFRQNKTFVIGGDW